MGSTDTHADEVRAGEDQGRPVEHELSAIRASTRWQARFDSTDRSYVAVDPTAGTGIEVRGRTASEVTGRVARYLARRRTG